MTHLIARLLCPLATLAVLAPALAGDLTPPPGPIQSTMKPLTDVEPRVAVNELNTPGDDNAIYVIASPGAYYLTDNLVGEAGKDGIRIDAANVTLDLMGFTLSGAGDGVGVHNALTAGKITIVNGFVTAWGDGIVLRNFAHVEDVTSTYNTYSGIEVGNTSLIRNCIAAFNGWSGISVGIASAVNACIAHSNTQHGIVIGKGIVSNCTCDANGLAGIYASYETVVCDNMCSAPTMGGSAVGIHVDALNRVVNNLVYGGSRGLQVDGVNNDISGNSVQAALDNYSIVPGNRLNILLCQIPESIDWPCTVTLAGDLTGVTAQHGIAVNADHVTIDLGGHALIGVAGALSGIYMSAFENLTIRNGTIRDWGDYGVNAFFRANVHAENVHISDVGDTGLLIGDDAQLTRCSATRCGGAGIAAISGAIVTECVASHCLNMGINVSYGSTIQSCTAHDNDRGFYAYGSSIGASVAYLNTAAGFQVDDGTSLVDCSAVDNADGIIAGTRCTVTNCAAQSNDVSGIAASGSARITGCDVVSNGGDGILVGNLCDVRSNRCYSNGAGSGTGAGIHATSSPNSIVDNTCGFAERGLDIDAGGNLISKNIVRDNVDNYDIVGSNRLDLLLSHLPESIDWPATVTLTGDLTGVSGSNGITIAADNVTIDLGGHALVGVGGSLDGINVSGSRRNIAIRNGTARNWAGDGIDAASAGNAQFENLKVSNNTGDGLRVGVDCAARACSALNNGGDGIEGGGNGTILECVANANTQTGILAGDSTVVANCEAAFNAVDGIRVATGSTVRHCTVRGSVGDGIEAGTSCTIAENHTDLSGNGGSGAGVHITGTGCRVEGNTCLAADRGVDVDSTGNLIIRNTARSNTTNYDIVAGNRYGPIIDITAGGTAAVTGNSAASTMSTTDPWANFAY
ncbi:MAG: hypothetical protein CHACPFDD_00110 [Phycisphaerae bacterium]|nr:hypothetical protein [Phycisphaerae bacterium]